VDGLEQIFIAQRTALRHTAHGILHNRELAEDVVQEAYLRLREQQQASSVREPVAYFFQTVRNLSIDRLRRLNLEANVFAVDDEAGEVESSTGSPEHIAIDRENLRRAEQVLTTLPRRTRQAFELHRIGGHTQQEVAVRLGVSTTLVNFMLRDAALALARHRD
jgi:RNA polymerase sigma factor (sigma-70 family)